MRICTYNVCNTAGCTRLRMTSSAVRKLWHGFVPNNLTWYAPFIELLTGMMDAYPHQAKSRKLGCIWHPGLYILARTSFTHTETVFAAQGNWWQRMVPRTFMLATFDNFVVANTHLTSPEFYKTADEHAAVIALQMQEVHLAAPNFTCADFNHEVAGDATSLNLASPLNAVSIRSCVPQFCVDTIMGVDHTHSHFPVVGECHKNKERGRTRSVRRGRVAKQRARVINYHRFLVSPKVQPSP